jgi:hypothetical protein
VKIRMLLDKPVRVALGIVAVASARRSIKRRSRPTRISLT